VPRTTPTIQDETLTYQRDGQARSLTVGSPDWYRWLDDAATFAFVGRHGAFTARKEPASNGRGGWYWRAYRKHDGTLRHRYLGRSGDLTLERLQAAALALEAWDGRSSAAAETGRAVDRPSGRRSRPLSEPLSSFIGRATEIAEVGRLLATARLLTLTGAGGVGKTRLALRVAAERRPTHPDAVCLVDLAPLADPALVAQAVAAALGVAETPTRPLLDTLADTLRRRRLLLVLDNCERLLDACAALAERLLRAAPALRILATSRAPLGVAGEVAWRVPSLTAAEGGTLFVERAIAARPDFRLTPEHDETVARICRWLDGIPLAIELAAVRIAALSPADIVARLDDSLGLLTTGSRTAQPRHQTLRATLDWSHGLLTEPERILFRRLAVFAGGWTLAAVEAVCAGVDLAPGAILDLLTGLIDKSLAQAEPTVGDGMRYRLLETVRQYAWGRLREGGEEQAVCDRHLAWCLALAATAESELHGPEQVAWLDRLESEHDNLRAALAWSLTANGDGRSDGGGAVEAGLRLAGAIWWFWFLRVYWREAVAWLDRLLARSDGMRSAARAKALNAAGVIRWVQLGDAVSGRRLLEESVALYRMVGDARGLAYALGSLGLQERRRGEGADYAGGTALVTEGLRLARASGDCWLIARLLLHEASSADATRAEEATRARAAAEESLGYFRVLGDTLGMGNAQRALGRVLLHQGDHERARAAFAADLAAMRAVGDRGGEVIALGLLGSVALTKGDHAGAAAHFRQWITANRLLGHDGVDGEVLERLAAAAVGLGRFGRAARLLGAASASRQHQGGARRRDDQPNCEATAGAAQAALGAAGFAAAWAEGQALSPDEAAAFALADEAEVSAWQSSPPTAVDNLTRREVEVLRLLAAGRSNREVAEDLSLSVRTVERHITNLYGKIGARGRADATAYAIRRGLA
jgi:non-specific serine/threonine protein kinase